MPHYGGRGPIKKFGDYQCNWETVIPPLRKGGYLLSSVELLSIPGDAPKDFIRVKEYVSGRPGAHPRHWPGYIAKVGSKFYPTESITEQLLTRFGQVIGVEIAESQLRVVAGQVRFLSKYFLRPATESLVHGIQIFEHCLDADFVGAIAETRQEREFYTFQTVLAAIQQYFPDEANEISTKLVEMLVFDALIGNNDRHPANWGVITPVHTAGKARFSPIFDTARALFWNNSESKVRQMLGNEVSFKAYISNSRPLISWDGVAEIDHFELVGHICVHYPQYRPTILGLCRSSIIEDCERIVESEFRKLMTTERRQLIIRCLAARLSALCECIS